MILLFADDVKMCMSIRTIEDAKLLQAELNNVIQWSERNRMPFARQKCNVISIRRTREFHVAKYAMGDHAIERKNEIRDLGLLVDNRMTFAAHIEQITTKARQSTGFIKWISKGQFNERTLKVLYTSYVRSKLEFAAVIWDPHSEIYKDDIESVQRQFVMYALGDTNRIPPYRLAPYEERCAKLGLNTLVARRLEINIMAAYDVFNGVYGDRNIEIKLVKVKRNRVLRENRLLEETLYLSDYSYNQPIARITRLINEFAELMTLSRSRFKVEIRKVIGERTNCLI